MKVVLRNPRREIELSGPRRAREVLKLLDVLPETVLLIRNDELVTGDVLLDDEDTLEIRPVMSGGGPGGDPR